MKTLISTLLGVTLGVSAPTTGMDGSVQALLPTGPVIVYYGYSAVETLQVVVSRLGGRFNYLYVGQVSELKTQLQGARVAIIDHGCHQIEAARPTIRFVQRGGRAAAFCGDMSFSVRQLYLDAGGLGVTPTDGVPVGQLRIPSQEYLPIGQGPLVALGGNDAWLRSRVSFARPPVRQAETHRLPGQPRAVLSAVAEVSSGQLLVAVTAGRVFFNDSAIGLADNERAAEVLVHWLLGKQ